MSWPRFKVREGARRAERGSKSVSTFSPHGLAYCVASMCWELKIWPFEDTQACYNHKTGNGPLILFEIPNTNIHYTYHTQLHTRKHTPVQKWCKETVNHFPFLLGWRKSLSLSIGGPGNHLWGGGGGYVCCNSELFKAKTGNHFPFLLV